MSYGEGLDTPKECGYCKGPVWWETDERDDVQAVELSEDEDE